jgi:hypothetical protein
MVCLCSDSRTRVLGPVTPASCKPPPCCLSSMAAMSWPLRILAVPVMPIDWATRCSSGNSIADSGAVWPPAPPEAAAPALRALLAVSIAPGQERTAPSCSWEVPGRCVAPTGAPPDSGRSAGSPLSAEYRSMVSLTRGPSQGAADGRSKGRLISAVTLYRRCAPHVGSALSPEPASSACHLARCQLASCLIRPPPPQLTDQPGRAEQSPRPLARATRTPNCRGR